MSTEPDPIAVQELSAALLEEDRLRSLSNEELVKEALKVTQLGDDELVVNEMFNRLWPGWSEQ